MRWYVLETQPGERAINSQIMHDAADESEALRWSASKYRLTADELAKLAASRSVTLDRLGGITVWFRKIRGGQ